MTKEKYVLPPGEIIPLNDNDMFIQIFNDSDNICVLEEFLSDYLEYDLEKVRGNLSIDSRDLGKDKLSESSKQVDLLLNYKDKKINIEISTGWSEGILNRNVVFISNLHGRQLNKGFKSYNEIDDTVQINLNAFRCLENIRSINYLMDETTGKILTKKLRIDIIDMAFGSKMCYTGEEKLDKLINWCKVFMSKSKDEFNAALSKIVTKKTKEKLVSNVSRLSGDRKMVKKYVGKTKWEMDRESTIEYFDKKIAEVDDQLKDLVIQKQDLDNQKQDLDNQKIELDNIRKNINLKLYNAKADGINSRNIEIAKNMLEEKIDINSISKVTGLSKEEIEKLK